MDNTATQEAPLDNSSAQGSTGSETAAATSTETTTTSAPVQTQSGGWKSQLKADLVGSPLLSKFDDTAEGLNKAIESHANLEKLLGHDKVPIPKDANDVEGWNRFSKALGIPDKAEGYGLPDATVPENMKGLQFDKNKFADIAHAHKLTPAQAKGLWESYTKSSLEEYGKAMEAHQKNLETTVNTLKGQWGDAYQANVELGQMVINKFSDDQATNDFITATLTRSPEGIKFLAKIGNQFAENKVGEFSSQRFSLAPEQAQDEWHKIVRDPQHPYNNDKATPREREAAISYVNSLIAKARGIK
jgi:hypothetical protein